MSTWPAPRTHSDSPKKKHNEQSLLLRCARRFIDSAIESVARFKSCALKNFKKKINRPLLIRRDGTCPLRAETFNCRLITRPERDSCLFWKKNKTNKQAPPVLSVTLFFFKRMAPFIGWWLGFVFHCRSDTDAKMAFSRDKRWQSERLNGAETRSIHRRCDFSRQRRRWLGRASHVSSASQPPYRAKRNLSPPPPSSARSGVYIYI